MLKQGLYEQVVNTEIKDELRQLPEDSKHVEKIDTAESSSVLTQYLSEVVHKGLDRIAGDDISAQLNLVNKIVDLISQETAQDDLRDFTVDDEGEQLFALLSCDDPYAACCAGVPAGYERNRQSGAVLRLQVRVG